ncbi:RNA polymerase sigma factor [Streptacidiphilus carbonis]|uniref:RNA polymerase sigma factor n=1 Tax=Streptacidiphilus carbonis TaxID=105422 RepID=UPI0005A9A595|nr:RNA polymerase sigma factor [Streptacidiphilus carbonis]
MPGPQCDDLRSSFDSVFCALLPRLYRRAALLAGGSDAAEDAVHEVYLKLAARPQRFLAHPEPYAYAFAALVSQVRDSYRRGRRQVLVADPGHPADGAGTCWDGGFAERASQLEALSLLGRLTVRQAAAVILVDLDGYTIDQAAGILGTHRGTVSRSRARALDKLRGCLGERPAPARPADIAEGQDGHASQGTA